MSLECFNPTTCTLATQANWCVIGQSSHSPLSYTDNVQKLGLDEEDDWTKVEACRESFNALIQYWTSFNKLESTIYIQLIINLLLKKTKL